MTSGVTFATHGWHLYLAAGILPFASGTGSACKGVMLDLVEAEMRSDALSAIALVEKLGTCVHVPFMGQGGSNVRVLYADGGLQPKSRQ